MAGGPSLRTQWSAQRFMLRRFEYAVLGAKMPPRRDPLRAQKLSLLVGYGLGCAVLAVDAILGFSGHGGIPGDAMLVMSRESGGLFVRVDGRLRPVANLTSARLIIGSPVTPQLVDEAALRDTARGPLLGIPGAPSSPGQIMTPRDVRWAVCDDAEGKTTVTVGDDSVPPDLDPHTAVVATAAHGDGSTYLIHDGKRALLDPGDPATARALRIDAAAVRTVSSTLLNAIPEVPPIGTPRIAGAGHPSGIAGVPIGVVLRVVRMDTAEYYVALPGGLQRIGRLAAELIRFSDPAAPPEIDAVAPELIARSPLVDALPVGTYPDEPPALLDAHDDLCATWQSGRTGAAVGRRTVDRPGAATLSGADGDGPAVDIVSVPTGAGLDVAEVPGKGRYLITSAGIRFPVHESAVAALGLSDKPADAPWPIVGVLPAGPQLERSAASVGRDVLIPAP